MKKHLTVRLCQISDERHSLHNKSNETKLKIFWFQSILIVKKRIQKEYSLDTAIIYTEKHEQNKVQKVFEVQVKHTKN